MLQGTTKKQWAEKEYIIQRIGDLTLKHIEENLVVKECVNSVKQRLRRY